MPKFSIIFPAYKEPGTIPENIERLYNQSKDIEFLVGPEAWSDEDMKMLEELAKKYPIKIRAHKEKMGKVRKLNELISIAEGDILVFFDNDAAIENPTLLKDIEEALEKGDFGSGIIKIRGTSVTERCARIDYLNTNATVKIQELMRASFGLNGAFIFAKREVLEKLGGFARVITEDVDFGIRATKAGFIPVFIEKHCITTGAPSTWRSWYRQRIRWAIGGAQNIYMHFGFLLRKIVPAAVQGVTVAPSGPIILAMLLLPNKYFEKLVALLFSFSALFFPGLIALFYAGIAYLAVKYLAVLIAGFFAILAWVWYWRRRFGFHDINLWKDVPIYYFIYVPIWTTIIVGAIIYVIYKRGKIERVGNWIV